MDSVLLSVKEMLGIDQSYTYFDNQLILFVNAALMILRQLGVGPEGGYKITSEFEEWNDVVGDTSLLEGLKPYVFMKVKLMFDPPQSNTTLNAYNEMIRELEYRLYTEAELIKRQEDGNE